MRTIIFNCVCELLVYYSHGNFCYTGPVVYVENCGVDGMSIKDILFILAICVCVVAIALGLALLVVYVSYWFIVPTAIFVIGWPYFLWKIVEWWVWR